MQGVVKFLSARDIPGSNSFYGPPLATFEAELVRILYTSLYKKSLLFALMGTTCNKVVR